jgi:hypothetical protein
MCGVKGTDMLAKDERCAIREMGLGEVTHEFFGQEESFLVGHRAIGIASEDEIDTKIYP